MTHTAADVPVDVLQEFQRLSFLAQGGDPQFVLALEQAEAELAHHALITRRHQAAEVEAVRVAAAKEARRAEIEARKLDKLHLALLDAKRNAFGRIQALTEELAKAVTFALEIEAESRSTHLLLGIPAGRQASALIEDHVGHRLNVAGLRSFPLGIGSMGRAPLVD